MEIIHSIVNSLLEAVTVCPWWIYALCCMAVITEVRKDEDITGFRPKFGRSLRYCLVGCGGLTLVIAVARWAMPSSAWVEFAHRPDGFIDAWISAHYWWSLLLALFVAPPLLVIGLAAFFSQLGEFLGIAEDPIQTPEPSGGHGTAGIATDEDLASAGLTGGKWGEGIRLGYDAVGRAIRYLLLQSVMLIGASGDGKTTDFLSFLLAEAGKKSMIVIDPACQLTPLAIEEARKRGRVIVIAPYRELLPPGVAELLGPTDSFNVMADLDPQSEAFPKQCDTLADILVTPDNSGESKETGHFTEGARGLVSGVSMGLKLYCPEKANLAEVCNIICIGDLIFKFAEEMKKRGNPHVLTRLSSVTSPNAKKSNSVADILQTAQLKLKFISDPAMHAVFQNHNWRLSELKDGDRPTTIFLCIAETMVPHSGPFMGLFLSWTSEALLSTLKGKRPVVFAVDEFPLLGKGAISTFSQLFSIGRRHGVQAYVCAQNYGQIKDMAGDLGAESLTSGCGVQVYLAPRDPITADRISKLTGQRSVVTRICSFGQEMRDGTWRPGVNFPEHGQPVFDAHQVQALGRNHFFMFAPGLVNNVIIGRRKSYWLDEEVRRRCGRDPYHPADAGNASNAGDGGGRKKKGFLRWLWEV